MNERCLINTPRFEGRFFAYVNPFKNCSTTETLYHIIDLILQGKLCPVVIEPFPYEPETLHLPDGALDKGNVLIGDYEANTQEVRKLIYEDARQCWTRLRKQDKKMPALGPQVIDIAEGLRQIQGRCIDAQTKADAGGGELGVTKPKRRGNRQLEEHIKKAQKKLLGSKDPILISRRIALDYPEYHKPKPQTITKTMSRMKAKS